MALSTTQRLGAAVMMVLAVMVASAAAQTGATLAGQTRDTNGAPVPGVRITITQTTTALVRTAVTDADGRFHVAGLPPGPYMLRAELEGFKTAERDGLSLTVGEPAAIQLTMQVAASDAVTVAAATRLNVRSPELSFLVDERTIANAPVNGRNFTDLMSLQPAVTPFPNRDNGSVVAHGLAMSVNGQDPRANVYLLDGTLLNDFTNGPAGSAAGTALGMETIREFRVEASGYGAEFGRSMGGQINAITRSGTNLVSGSAFEFYRDDALDARNYFDVGAKPSLSRHQAGGTIGGPLRRDGLFYFVGYETLQESLGRTIVTTVPDDDARAGRLPGGVVVPIDPAVDPYLQEFPRANGETLGDGLARFTFPFDQKLDQHFFQARIDGRVSDNAQAFVRYTGDVADHRLPTDYPQFPRAFVSDNHFVTAEYRQAIGNAVFHTARFGFSATRIGQTVEANTTQPLSAFVPGRPFMGAIDIGGMPRFGPQSSVNVQLNQDVYAGQYDLVQTRGRHFLTAGFLVEHYRDDERNPTFSLGIFRFANLTSFMTNQAAQFIGLTPEGDIRRHWNWTLFGGYIQDEMRVAPTVTLNAGLRVESATLPRDTGNRDINMPDLLAPTPTVGPLYDNPAPSVSPRTGVVWDVGGAGRTSVRGGYGLYYNTSNQQNLIVTITNPPATPRVVIANPTFPVPPFERGTGISVRPMQFDLAWPRVHMWNVNVQQAFGSDWTVTIGYAATRGRHLWRNSDRNIPTPEFLADGTPFYPMGLTRPNTAFSAIEQKSSDGDSWYRALIVDVRKVWSRGWQLQSSYTWSRAEDTTQNSTFFSDSTTATTSAMPEFIPDYNRGLSDFHAAHNWVTTAIWQLPDAAGPGRAGAVLLSGWQVAGILRFRSGQPLTPFLQTNRSRSLWAPSLGPGTGPDRPSYAPGRGPENAVLGRQDRWLDPTAFVLPPRGTYGNVGRNEIIGPDLRTVDVAVTRQVPLGARSRLEFRLEVFNVFNRANFGPPSLIAFAGTADVEAPLASFGEIRTTVTSSRQSQVGVRLVF